MATALSQITRSWTNPYKSQMTLQGSGGILNGHYASTTGASGVYQVFGYIDPNADAVVPGGPGVPVGLILNWRSIQQGGEPDPSWNYVSGIGGQLICNEAGQTVINVNHALIASNPLPGYVSEAGFFVDRILYDATQTQNDSDQTTAMEAFPERYPLQGGLIYADTQNPTTKLILLEKPHSAGFWAGFEWNGISTALMGTCNTGYSQSIGPYQSIAFCGAILPGLALSLSGWLDHRDNTITLQRYVVGPQIWDSRYFQAQGSTLTMQQH